MFENKCPLCGTFGKMWNKNPQAFICPNCMSVFTHFGLVLENDNEMDDMLNLWS